MSKRLFRLFGLNIAIVAHGMAYFLFHRQIATLPLPPYFQDQFVFLLALSLLLAFTLPFSRSLDFTWLILILRGGILLLMNQPLGGNLGVEAALLTALIVEAHLCFSWRVGLIYSLCLIALTLNSRFNPIKAWGVYLPCASNYNLILFGIYAGFITVFSAFFRFLIDNQVPARELNRRLDEATLQLTQANYQLLEYAAVAEQEAVQNERKRFAREIHDTLAYTLTNLVVMVDAAKDLAAGDRKVLMEHLTLTHNQAKEGLLDVRRAIQALRPTRMSETTGLPAVYRLVQAFVKATQIEVQLNLGNVPLFLDEEADLAIYRLVQEGLTNALRHGKATEIEISFSLLKGGVCILVKDNGVGSTSFKEGYGLMGMRERIEHLGGSLEGAGGPEGGFSLTAWIPMKEDHHGED